MAAKKLSSASSKSGCRATEAWANDPLTSKDMVLADGYYGSTADAFEFISRRTAHRQGHGLPGTAWESGLPVFQEDLGKGGRFLRARRFETWLPDADGERLFLAGGFCEATGTVPASQALDGVERGEGSLGRAVFTGLPALSDTAASESGLVGQAAVAAALAVVALPVLRDGRVVAVAAWYF